MAKILTDEEMSKLLPTITFGKEEPKTQVWLTRSEALKAMRDVEAEVLRRLSEGASVDAHIV